MNNNNVLIDRQEFRRRLAGASPTGFWELSKRDARFPKIIPIGRKASYREDEVSAYLDALAADRELVGA